MKRKGNAEIEMRTEICQLNVATGSCELNDSTEKKKEQFAFKRRRRQREDGNFP